MLFSVKITTNRVGQTTYTWGPLGTRCDAEHLMSVLAARPDVLAVEIQEVTTESTKRRADAELKRAWRSKK